MTSPHLLPEDSITLSNFKVYIQFYIQRDYLTPLHSRATTPSPAKSCHPDDYNSVPKQDLPKPFTLDALETNKRLNIFAERLAQKLERTRLEGEGVRKRGVPLRENGSTDWVKPSVSGFRGSMSSWNTGSVTLLPGPTAKGGKRDVKEQGKREGGMKGEKLKGKVKGLCEKVLRLMREAGEIVLALDEVEEEEEKARFDPDDLFSLAAHGLSREFPFSRYF
jgi:WD40 repeat protein